jgi:hypothetical protein
MAPPQQKGPFCQSCSMPLAKPEDFGTDRAGFRVNDYCTHCYKDGAFTEPELTLPEMIDRCVGIMAAQRIMTANEARALLSDVMPRMKRWRELAVR